MKMKAMASTSKEKNTNTINIQNLEHELLENENKDNPTDKQT